MFSIGGRRINCEKFLNWHPSELHPWFSRPETSTTWWFFTNPFGKISWSNRIISPGFGVKIKKKFETYQRYGGFLYIFGRGGNPNVIGSFRRGIWYMWEGLKPPRSSSGWVTIHTASVIKCPASLLRLAPPANCDKVEVSLHWENARWNSEWTKHTSPGSQVNHHLQKMVVPFGWWSKPLLKKWWFGNLPMKNRGWTSG